MVEGKDGDCEQDEPGGDSREGRGAEEEEEEEVTQGLPRLRHLSGEQSLH